MKMGRSGHVKLAAVSARCEIIERVQNDEKHIIIIYEAQASCLFVQMPWSHF